MSATGTIKLGTAGIKKTLSQYSPAKAIFEFIWNGFDANAKTVAVTATTPQQGFDVLDRIIIADDGEGIPYAELNAKFRPFMESSKGKPQTKFRTSNVQGKDGRGRLTFFKFASQAVWHTQFKSGEVVKEYSITIAADSLDTFHADTPRSADGESTGTRATFTGIDQAIGIDFIEGQFLDELKAEFGWFLKLNSRRGLKILLNGWPVEFQSLILAEDQFEIVHQPSRTRFYVQFVQWSEKLTEYSKFYFLDSKGEERFKQNTTFNNKGDGFNHSLYIQSRYFDNWSVAPADEEEQAEMFFDGDKEPFRFLKEELAKYIRKQRKRVLRAVADKMLDTYEQENVFPVFSISPYDEYRREDLKEVIRTVYEADPRIFVQLNLQQKKTLVGFLNLLLDSDERDRVLTLLEQIIQLDEDEQKQLIRLLRTTELNRIISTIHLIQERFNAVAHIRDLVFRPDLKANEIIDLQSAIEAHYWLFGEQFHLVTAAEPSFEEALRRFTYILTGASKKAKIDHPDKEREMDIFAIRQITHSSKVESIIVELKHPRNVMIGSKELQQVKDYMDVILEEPQFNGGNREWKFILVGNRYDKAIERELENNKNHGEPSLVFRVGSTKIYVRTWDEIFTEFQCKHDFLNKHLKLKLNVIQKAVPQDKVQIQESLSQNSARMPAEITTETPHAEIDIAVGPVAVKKPQTTTVG